MSNMGLVIHIGSGGVLGVLFGCVIAVCGLLLWFHPVQRIFYSIVAILVALAALIESNLGGFLLGTLLGIIGGSLGFAWAPGPREPRRRHRRARLRGSTPPGGVGMILGEPGSDTEPDDGKETGAVGEWPLGDRTQPTGDRADGGTRSGGRLLALPLAPILLVGSLLPGHPAAPMRSAYSAQTQGCILIIFCPPSPTPSPSSPGSSSPAPQPSTSPGPLPLPLPTGTAGPVPSPQPSATSTGGTSSKRKAKTRTAAAPALMAPTAQSTLTAGSVLLEGFAYDGVASVPTANGTQAMMKFSASSIHLSGTPTLTIIQNGNPAVTRVSTLSFTGNVTLYATKLSGDLLGAPITITPQSPLATILQLLAPLTQLVPVPMTNVVTDQPLTIADSSQWNGFKITVG